MARPKKTGLDYFPFDVDIFEDEKFFDLQNEYGPLGEVIYLRLLCMVYRSGYYYRFDSLEKLAAMLIRSIGNRWARDKQTVIDVILFLAKINLFSAELMQEHVITSRGIQERYLAATERRQTEISEYSLLEKTNVREGILGAPEKTVSATETNVSATEIGINDCDNAPKESKENEIKVDERKGSFVPSSSKEALIEKYGKTAVAEYEQKYREWCSKNGKAVKTENMYTAISKWLAADRPRKQMESSLDTDAIDNSVMEKYRRSSQ